MKQKSILLFLVVLVMALQPAVADVVINEIMYHPSTSSLDEFLELHNNGASSVDLQSWCLDAISFCFPVGASIAAGQYLLLAKDATSFQATYGFAPDFTYTGALNNVGESLILQDALLTFVDQVDYAEAGEWPVTPDGLGPSLELIDAAFDNNTARNWRASTHASGHTAGAINSVAGAGLPPWITNVAHGAVSPNQPIVVTAAVADATTVDLIYKLDFGGETTIAMADDGLSGDGAASDGVYGASIPGQPIATLVRYRLVATGATGTLEHPRVDDTIEYKGTVVVDPAVSSNLPIFQWYIDPVDYQNALDHAETDETEPAVLYYNGQLWDSVQIRVRGKTARRYDKKQWKFIFPQGHNFVAPDLGVEPIDRMNLHGNWSDKSAMREILAWETVDATGGLSLITFHIQLRQNGDFFGLYHFIEQPDSEWLERVGLDPEGAYYKSFDDCRRRSLANLPPRYEKKTRLEEDYSDLLDTLLGPMDLLSGQDKKDFLYDAFNLPEQINYMANMILFHGNDHVGRNYYLYRDTNGTGRWQMHAWDLDLTFGRNFTMQVLNDEIWADVDSILDRPDVSPSHPLFGDILHQKWDYRFNYCIDGLLDEPTIREMFMRRLRTLMDEILVAPVYENRIDQLQALIASEYVADELEWGQYGDSQTLQEAIDLIKVDFLVPRRTHLFTTHRVPGMIPAAQSASPNVVINEIMYNPIGGPLHEFVELYNPSASEAVDLSGWTFEGVLAFPPTTVIDLTIPAGTVIPSLGYAVFVFNDVTFRTEYGGGKFVPDEYPAALDNAGLTLTIKNHLDQVVDQVAYDDVSPWPTTPDGAGPSLELMDPASDNTVAANWAASLDPGGTPGAQNSTNVAPPPPELYINEVMPVNSSTLMDGVGDYDPWIEIYNADPSMVDLSGMFLSNSDLTPTQWAFPAGTQLCSGCYLVVWVDSEVGEGPLHANFSLSGAGGSVYLWTSGGVEIDHLDYPAVASDIAYGRYPDSSAGLQELFVPTPEATNLGNAPAVILNEYNAVSNSNFLKNSGSDTYWGTIMGNGGDWFELVVVQDHVDLRGWKLMITEDTGTAFETTETLTFSSDPIWADLRCGTIITVSENLADDVSYDPLAGDWWINVQAANAGSGTYITAVNFPVSNDRWQLTIKNDADEVIFGPAGEGVNPASGIGNEEIFKLEEDPNAMVSPFSNYQDGSSSSFGSPNIWSGGISVQDFDPLRIKVGSLVTATITSPSNGAEIDEGSAVAVTATATSTNGTITQVEFFVNDGGGPVSIGVDTTAPFSRTWTGFAPGSYTLTAEATDDYGVSATSPGVNVTVPTDQIFSDGFETGNVSAWSNSVGF